MRRNKRHRDFEGAAVMSASNAVAQRKSTVGAVNDPLEHEADHVASKVMRMPEAPLVQRKPSCSCGGYDDEYVHLKPLAAQIAPFMQAKAAESGKTGETVLDAIQATKGRGSEMQPQIKNIMENQFNADFSDVRIHTDSEAVQLSKLLNAQAFTTGNDIYFNEGNTGQTLMMVNYYWHMN